MLAELAHGMRTGRVEQEHLVLSKRKLFAVDDLRRVPAIDIADFDIIVHMLRYRVEARVAHD